jgi:hypothetical protein
MIQVKDIVNYLSTIPQDMEVVLDKDGWMEEYLPDGALPNEVIGGRGLFEIFDGTDYNEGIYLVINN